MRLAVRATVAIGITVGVVACTSFSAPPDSPAIAADGGADGGDAGACASETCDGKSNCKLSDFESGCGDWKTSGDVGTVVDCANGKLRIQAKNTLDAAATFSAAVPFTPYSLRLAARIVLNDWDGANVVRVSFDDTIVARLTASKKFNAMMQYKFCRTANECLPQELAVEAGAEHLFVLEIGAGETKVTIDCVPFVQEAGIALPANATLRVSLGHVDGNPMDVTFDDVVIQFR